MPLHVEPLRGFVRAIARAPVFIWSLDMARAEPGYARQLLYGTAGSAATNIVTNAKDVNINGPNQRWDTTTRGDGTAVPVHTEQTVQIVREITWTMVYKSDDTYCAAFISASKTGADVAIKVLRKAGGETEYNGDATVTLDSPGPLTDGQILSFTAIPSRDSGRDPALT